ncbi:hypothetical protein H072_7495 [Dactylellina haptotyla CBS 200.50]|uniref:Uncharacterized protein n=1 Tax=Dactylellina haptotyla (strain CBS 200.50) TaxID=1284197 RepID=S8A7G3_DACHA|nr:hypothetical protein H072_7495 [Dactylellina haptotyla CBS 200.50]
MARKRSAGVVCFMRPADWAGERAGQLTTVTASNIAIVDETTNTDPSTHFVGAGCSNQCAPSGLLGLPTSGKQKILESGGVLGGADGVADTSKGRDNPDSNLPNPKSPTAQRPCFCWVTPLRILT